MVESTPTKSMLASLLQRNAKLAVKVGPREIFHNHRAAALVASHALGAPSSYLESLFPCDTRGKPSVIPLPRPLKRGGFGLSGLGLHNLFWNWRAQLSEEADSHDWRDVVRKHFVTDLARGAVAADFLHAIIELGYGFESGEREVAISGLAWCYAGWFEVPRPSTDARVASGRWICVVYSTPPEK